MHSTEEVLGMSENVDVDEAAVTKQLIGERPNTYTFTKAHAEQGRNSIDNFLARVLA